MIIWTSVCDHYPRDPGYYLVWKEQTLGDDDEGPTVVYYDGWYRWTTRKHGPSVSKITHWCEIDQPSALTVIPYGAILEYEPVREAANNLYKAVRELQTIVSLTQ